MKIIGNFKCLKCNKEFESKIYNVTCIFCNHVYVKWLNYEECKKQWEKK